MFWSIMRSCTIQKIYICADSSRSPARTSQYAQLSSDPNNKFTRISTAHSPTHAPPQLIGSYTLATSSPCIQVVENINGAPPALRVLQNQASVHNKTAPPCPHKSRQTHLPAFTSTPPITQLSIGIAVFPQCKLIQFPLPKPLPTLQFCCVLNHSG